MLNLHGFFLSLKGSKYYALANSEESNSGVYFRLGGHYNLGSSKVFPQIMVGYATNLSSFVNKLKKED